MHRSKWGLTKISGGIPKPISTLNLNLPNRSQNIESQPPAQYKTAHLTDVNGAMLTQ